MGGGPCLKVEKFQKMPKSNFLFFCFRRKNHNTQPQNVFPEVVPEKKNSKNKTKKKKSKQATLQV